MENHPHVPDLCSKTAANFALWRLGEEARGVYSLGSSWRPRARHGQIWTPGMSAKQW